MHESQAPVGQLIPQGAALHVILQWKVMVENLGSCKVRCKRMSKKSYKSTW